MQSSNCVCAMGLQWLGSCGVVSVAAGGCGLAVDVILVAIGGREARARRLGVGRRLGGAESPRENPETWTSAMGVVL